MAFEVIYSTLAPSALASFVSDQYGLKCHGGELLVRGVGDTYQLRAADAVFILRVYRKYHRSLPQIETEVELLLACKEAGVSVSYPIEDSHGGYIQALDAPEGRRYAVLFSFAPGRVVARLSEGQLKGLGRQMALFHNVSSAVTLNGSRWTYDTETVLSEPLRRAKPFFAAENAVEYDWWMNAAAVATEELGKFDKAGFSSGYCQYDFLLKNFHCEGDRVTLFDFDFLGFGWLVNDLMTFWVQLVTDVYFNRMSQVEADGAWVIFVEGYRQHRSVSDEELRAIPFLSLGWWCFYMGFHTTHDQFMQFVHPTQLRFRTGLIRTLMERYWKLPVAPLGSLSTGAV